LGQKLAHPVVLAPTGLHRLFHEEGELATARGAGEAEALLTVSSLATFPIEEVAAAGNGPRWQQLYIQKDRGWTKELVQRAEAAGFSGFVLTADNPVLGARDRERRHGFALPDDVHLANMPPLGDAHTADVHHDAESIYNPYLDASIGWKDVEWLKGLMTTPLICKGILHRDDARLAILHGAAAVVCSNHGGRNLDGSPASIDALPAIVDAVDGRVPVLMDGGVRRGTDIVKALALGATAVMIGRPYVWGLAAAGADGVKGVIEILRHELETAMALCGKTALGELDTTLIWGHRAE
ncbi:MAG: alpha-hydroxy acid oxidase, partial [Planctomycetota bacterium]